MLKKNMKSFIIIGMVLIISLLQYCCYPSMNQTIKEKGNVDTFNDYVVDKARYLDYVLDLQLQKKKILKPITFNISMLKILKLTMLKIMKNPIMNLLVIFMIIKKC